MYFFSFLSFTFTSCILVLWPFENVLIFGLYMLMYVIHLSLHVLFIFSLYAHASYILYTIFYLCFILRCHNEFCLKCFRNTGCQSLLTINSLLANFFKSLWLEWFMTSIICLFVCCGFVTNFQRGRLLGHMCFTWLRTYVMILCNWLILWKNALYLYLGRFRTCLNTSRNYVSWSSVEAFKFVQENKLIVQIH